MDSALLQNLIAGSFAPEIKQKPSIMRSTTAMISLEGRHHNSWAAAAIVVTYLWLMSDLTR